MKVIIIAGFLGSGKTTLLLQMAKLFSSASKKTAIIENEIGEVGVDGDYLELEGLKVKQLLGGCICCTLSSGLVETLESLNLNYNPGTVMIEATGAADPKDIAGSLGLCRFKIQGIKIITIVDAGRYEMLMKMMTPLLSSQITAADVIVINKIDSVKSETVDHIIQDIGGMNNHGNIIATSLDKGPDLKMITDRLSC
jgi:G3E family GTPase